MSLMIKMLNSIYYMYIYFSDKNSYINLSISYKWSHPVFVIELYVIVYNSFDINKNNSDFLSDTL